MEAAGLGLRVEPQNSNQLHITAKNFSSLVPCIDYI